VGVFKTGVVDRYWSYHKVLSWVGHLVLSVSFVSLGHTAAQWLRHCTTNWKVTGSIPDGFTGIFH
jgi:hypothetical protein